MKSMFLVPAFMLGLAGSAVADPLPKTAVPWTPGQVKAFFTDRTAMFSKNQIYFRADMVAQGINPKQKLAYAGTWSVSGNEICLHFKDDKGVEKPLNCNKYWQDGKKVWSLWSQHNDGSQPDTANGYRTDEILKYKKGNLIAAQYKKFGGV